MEAMNQRAHLLTLLTNNKEQAEQGPDFDFGRVGLKNELKK